MKGRSLYGRHARRIHELVFKLAHVHCGYVRWQNLRIHCEVTSRVRRRRIEFGEVVRVEKRFQLFDVFLENRYYGARSDIE